MNKIFTGLILKISPYMEVNFHPDNINLCITGNSHPYSIFLPTSPHTEVACKALLSGEKREVNLIADDGSKRLCHAASVSRENNGIVILTEP